MTRIAILADIHGNVPALDAVVADIDAHDVDEVLVGGDLVGRGPQGSRVVERIRQRGWSGVRGNHEDYMIAFRRKRVPSEWLRSEEWSASRWMAAELSNDDERFLDALPFSITSRVEPELRLVHGTPRSHSEGIGPWNSDEELARHVGTVDEPLLVCAHTHRPLVREVRGGMVVNVGAVGLPFNRDRRAQYAILTRESGRWSAELRRVEYPIERTLETYEQTGFLRKGGATTRLLQLELEHAAPFLVPFLRWAAATNCPPRIDSIPAFLDFYDPEESVGTFLARLSGRR